MGPVLCPLLEYWTLVVQHLGTQNYILVISSVSIAFPGQVCPTAQEAKSRSGLKAASSLRGGTAGGVKISWWRWRQGIHSRLKSTCHYGILCSWTTKWGMEALRSAGPRGSGGRGKACHLGRCRATCLDALKQWPNLLKEWVMRKSLFMFLLSTCPAPTPMPQILSCLVSCYSSASGICSFSPSWPPKYMELISFPLLII